MSLLKCSRSKQVNLVWRQLGLICCLLFTGFCTLRPHRSPPDTQILLLTSPAVSKPHLKLKIPRERHFIPQPSVPCTISTRSIFPKQKIFNNWTECLKSEPCGCLEGYPLGFLILCVGLLGKSCFLLLSQSYFGSVIENTLVTQKGWRCNQFPTSYRLVQRLSGF